MNVLKGIIGLLIAALLGVVLLDKLGAADVTAKIGDSLRTKVGATSVQAAVKAAERLPGKDATEKDRTRYLEEVLGWNLRDLRKQPLRTVQEGLRLAAAEIERLENLSDVIYAEMIKAKKSGKATAKEVDTKRALLREAKNALTNPETKYPVKIGMYEYDRETLISVAGDTQHWLSAHGETESIEGSNLMVLASSAYTKVQIALEMMYKTKRALEQKENWFRVEELYADAEAAQKVADDLDTVVQTILNPTRRGKTQVFSTPAMVDNDARLMDELMNGEIP